MGRFEIAQSTPRNTLLHSKKVLLHLSSQILPKRSNSWKAHPLTPKDISNLGPTSNVSNKFQDTNGERSKFPSRISQVVH